MAVSTALMAATPSFDGARISRDVKELASDAYEGRGPATAGEEKTIAYLSKQFAEAGLQPGGDLANGKRAWTQAVPLRRADIVGTPTISVQNAGKPQALTQGKQIAIAPRWMAHPTWRSPTRRWCSSATASRRRSATGTTSRV